MMIGKKKHNTVFWLFFMFIFLMTAVGFTMGQKAKCIVTEPAPDANPLEQAFLATGAQLEDVFVDAWVQLERQDQTVEALRKVVEETAETLAGPATRMEFHTSAGAYHTTVKATGHTATQYIIITAQAVQRENSDEASAYLTVNVGEKDGDVDISGLESRIAGVVKEKGHPFSITTCLSGWVNGKLEEEKMTEAIRQAFQRVRAHMEEGISGPHFVSYAGVTDSIDRSVMVGKKAINLNMAMRHHSTEDRTYITAASPVITREY